MLASRFLLIKFVRFDVEHEELVKKKRVENEGSRLPRPVTEFLHTPTPFDALVLYRSRINRCIRYELKTSLVDAVLHSLWLVPHITPVCIYKRHATAFTSVMQLHSSRQWRLREPEEIVGASCPTSLLSPSCILHQASGIELLHPAYNIQIQHFVSALGEIFTQ
jgi:hypothetical protein